MAKQKYSDSELAAILSKELRQSLGSPGSEIAMLRLRNLQYYKAEAEGELAAPEITDRSSIVSTDVPDTINWMLPGLLRPFVTSQEALQASAKKPQFTEGAKACQEYLRLLFWKRNKGYNILRQWFMDAMIQKMGFQKVSWVETEEDAEENYEGLSEPQMTMLMADKEGKVIAATPRQVDLGEGAMTVYDATFKRTEKKGKCVVAPCPPEEMRVHPRARYGQPVPFIAHVFPRSRQDLEADGYDLTNVNADEGWSMEQIERVATQTPWFYDSSDGEMQQYKFAECYIRLDDDEDGIAEWLKVGMIGETIAILNGKPDRQKVDDDPFVYFCPSPMPHQFFGNCPADWAIEPQRFRTSLLRSCADNVYLSVNQRTGVVEGQVNLDDLLNSRPGGIVRLKNANAMVPIQQAGLDQSAWAMVEWAETWREDRTGFSKETQGINPDIFDATKGGTQILTDRADQRIELMAREASFAVEQLFNKMLKCISLYQNTPETAELSKGAWQTIDPRDWHKQYELELDVGLGTGSKEKQGVFLGQLLPIQRVMIEGGVIDPQGAVVAAKNMAEFMGLPNPEQYFPPAQPKPPQPSPEEIKAQSAERLAQINGQITVQVESAKAQANMQVAQFQTQQEMQQAATAQAGEIQKFQAEAQIKNADKIADREMQLVIEREKCASAERIEAARIASAERIEGAKIQAAQIAAEAASKVEERVNISA